MLKRWRRISTSTTWCSGPVARNTCCGTALTATRPTGSRTISGSSTFRALRGSSSAIDAPQRALGLTLRPSARLLPHVLLASLWSRFLNTFLPTTLPVFTLLRKAVQVQVLAKKIAHAEKEERKGRILDWQKDITGSCSKRRRTPTCSST